MPALRILRLTLVACALAVLAGCQSFLGYRGWPYPEHDRTSFHTPRMRIDTVKQFAGKADGTNSDEQREFTDQLARQIQIEPDPLVREAIVRAVAEFHTPLATQILEAALQDESPGVRIASCKSLGKRVDKTAISQLATLVRDSDDQDVRLAAVEALGNMKDPTAMAAVAVALDDRDPAMQFVGVQSMKSITGKDYGNNVETWRQVAAGKTPTDAEVSTIADRMRDALPFR